MAHTFKEFKMKQVKSFMHDLNSVLLQLTSQNYY